MSKVNIFARSPNGGGGVSRTKLGAALGMLVPFGVQYLESRGFEISQGVEGIVTDALTVLGFAVAWWLYSGVSRASEASEGEKLAILRQLNRHIADLEARVGSPKTSGTPSPKA